MEFALDSKGLWANAILYTATIYLHNLQWIIYSKVSMEKMQGILTSWSLLFFFNSLSWFFLSLSLSEGLEEPVKQKDISDGVYAYEYYPHTPGKYTVTITWAGQHIPKRWASPEPITAFTFNARATSHTRPLRSEKSSATNRVVRVETDQLQMFSVSCCISVIQRCHPDKSDQDCLGIKAKPYINKWGLG